MKVRSKLVELCPSRLLLQLGFLQSGFSGKILQLFPDLLVLGLHVLKVGFPCVEVVLVFAGVETSVVFLNYFCLLGKEFTLLVLHFILFLIHKLATANITSPHSLYFESCSLLIVELPLDLEHPPVLLDYYCCGVFLVAEFFCLIKHREVLVYEVSMTAFTLF